VAAGGERASCRKPAASGRYVHKTYSMCAVKFESGRAAPESDLGERRSVASVGFIYRRMTPSSLCALDQVTADVRIIRLTQGRRLFAGVGFFYNSASVDIMRILYRID
jgi:hypothetical protein